MEDFDCVVIGAGLYGLAAARQFHYTHPGSSMVILDAQSSLGGTWAEERLYPGLKSNNLLGTYEYPDFPMISDRYDVKPGEHIKGTTLHSYLEAYAEHNGIAELIRLNHKVLAAEHQDDGGWILTILTSGRLETKASTRRLIVATGLTSNAFLPHFDGQGKFGGRIFHGKYFQQNRDTLKTAKAVTVFGATKFAWDAVYAYATSGVKVNWVIRSSGHGPCWISSPYATPFKIWMEQLANTRLITWFSPCIWGEADGYSWIRGLLHSTVIGRFLVNSFWKALTSGVMAQNNYDAHPDTAKLKPWTEALFTGDSLSVLNYDTDIFSLVRSDLVDIHIGEIDHLSAATVHLADGTSFASDVLLANTGWKHVPAIKFLPEGIADELGIPHQPTDSAPVQDLANQQGLIDAADREILRRFPRLKDQPVWNANYKPMTEQKGINSGADEITPYTSLTPYMLYRFLVPASPRFLRTRDIAFAGMLSNLSNATTAHISGLWISAFFAGKLAMDVSSTSTSPDENALERLRYETVLHNRWGKWRYPTDWGTKRPSFTFDAVPYFDLLQRDLGLSPHRKGGWFAEFTQPYMPKDYRDITDEWMRKQKDWI
ncbi:uncharacterized protein F4807DRAFT_40473 [Annulohypoxylon truncatum]|uniref:uncharacterized protein n=1 Tax=Annulohypoxylon truncatum TaxID=327061 RepID=UPI002008EB64|nr:uncharacterized protein F4807DRAFT_40473 [Annulohypoxylon truncatum]KAI1210835.1 hypothetical protein F4807DRAFT_40473 [Annulohypoxylon truncatum]